jgi:uncharacterized protein (TIGR02145 family)
MRNLIFVLACLLSFSLFGQSPCNNQISVTYQGYEYDIVEIGDQCWFAENCRYLPDVSPPLLESNIVPHYYVYDNTTYSVRDAKASFRYDMDGVLYNWPAAISENVCPSGWHLPTDKEFTQLIDFLGGEDIAGKSMKSESAFDHSITNGTNSSGFSGLPSGYRYVNSNFQNLGYSGAFWSSSAKDDSSAFLIYLSHLVDYAYFTYERKEIGYSVRCVRD